MRISTLQEGFSAVKGCALEAQPTHIGPAYSYEELQLGADSPCKKRPGR